MGMSPPLHTRSMTLAMATATLSPPRSTTWDECRRDRHDGLSLVLAYAVTVVV